MHHPTDRITHTTAFVTPVVEHWLDREIAQWVHPMKDRSDVFLRTPDSDFIYLFIYMFGSLVAFVYLCFNVLNNLLYFGGAWKLEIGFNVHVQSKLL